MPRRPRIQYPNALYHVTSRGNARQVIFHADDDRLRFIEQLGERVETYGIVIYAYVLMDNHYHLLLRTPRSNLDRFMQRLNTSYALYYRYKHDRPGHVFQGRYTARLVADDSYFLQLTRYIHLNPVKTAKWKCAGKRAVQACLRAYRWSSYPAYLTGRSPHPWLCMEALDHLGDTRSKAVARYRLFTEAMIASDDVELKEAMQHQDSLPVVPAGEDHAEIAMDRMDMTLDAMDAAVARHYGIDPALFQGHGRGTGAAKRVALAMAERHSNASRSALGIHYGGITPSALIMNRKRLQKVDLEAMDQILCELRKRSRRSERPAGRGAVNS